ncbi:hypothetical protein BGZ95_011895 [Linnemannia exigua]|uniref:Phospholipase n=1 Tax=Linnemannia exigua TaxID=604196 RepID=A0AAD4D9A3_9FUNG|nr:hypothetical protein BGZ95_011895 [Linnemannia exigua]
MDNNNNNNNSHSYPQHQDDPIHLATLVSTDPGNKGQSIDSSSYDPSNEKNLDLNNNQQFLLPQPQQQQQQQYPVQPSLEITNASQDALVPNNMNEKDFSSFVGTGTDSIQPPAPVAAPRMKLANLVDKVRVAQILEKSQPDLLSAETSVGANTSSSSSIRLSPLSSNTLDQPESGKASGSMLGGDIIPTTRRPSSTIHNVIEDPEEHHHQSHLRLHSHSRDGGGEDVASGHHRMSHLFPKIFSKDGIRNALFLNSAATAFQKHRAKEAKTMYLPAAALAVMGSAVPALWMRRDDKGRRPPAVLFQMLRIAVTDSEIDLGVSKQIIFRLEMQYGDVKWVIRRTLYEFYKLHLILSAKRFDNLPKFPSQVSYAFSMAKASIGMRAEEKINYIRQSNLARRQALQDYLIQTLQSLDWTVAYDLYEFLEISALSLTKDMGWKGKESYVETKVTDNIHGMCSFGRLKRWNKNWALLRDSYLAFCSTVGSEEPTDVFIFDQTFYVNHKEHYLGLNMHHIEIGNSHRKIEIKGDHNREMLEWMENFTKLKQSSPWVNSHRFGSFAPQRSDAKVRYYVDGKDYFHAVSDAILAAKTEIYICDWWLSPELYLRRPPEKNEEFRLDRLLKKKAMEGVMIYIVVYKEISLALTLDSAHTKIWLQDLHPNIQVQRHPDHISVTATQFWAHHEKICVVDCRLAFIGGLDLCFGRYDSRTHQLADYHPSGGGTIWPGQDYSNPRIKDFANVRDYNNNLIERKLLARMPWHDVSVGVAGQPARDIARHFVQRWNFVKLEKGMKKSHMKFLTPKGEFVSTRNESGWTGTQKVQLLRSSTLWSQGVDLERSIQDAYLSCIQNAEHFIYIENQFFVTLAAENGHPDLKNKIGIALVERITRAHNEGKKFRVIVVMPLMPAFEADIMSSEAGTLRKYIGFYGLRSFDRIKHGKFDAIVEAVREAEERRKGNSSGSNNGTSSNLSQASMSQEHLSEADLNQPQAPRKAGGKNKGKSLASMFLLEPIPRGEEAARIEAIANERKELDMRTTWDDSITKRAMNPAVREHGYIPAATENSLADSQINANIQQETYEAEIAAGNHGSAGNTSPQILDGLGTMVRSAVEKVKGTKEQGDLEPRHHKITRDSLFHRHHHQHDDDEDSVHMEERQGRESMLIPHWGEDDKDKQSIKDGAESIIEPVPGDAREERDEQEGPSTGDEAEPVPVTRPIVDNEVEDFVTEQLYIHSKLMIVDDRIIICGSANINDRSQVGFRDSEIAMIIEDTDMVPSRMNGEPYQAGKLAHALRTDLFKEHLGLLHHVDHDVVTKASVLPVDLDAPHKDPEQERLELIRKANAQAQEQQQQAGSSSSGVGGILQVPAGEDQQNSHIHHPHPLQQHHDGMGYVQTYTPNVDETKAMEEWLSPNPDDAQGDAKKATAKDPEAANQIVMDPLHDSFYEGWWKPVAKTNTEIFREVFRCVPDDSVETWDEYRAFVPNPKKVLQGHVAMEGATADQVTDRLQRVTGHLVEFPTKFLSKENLMGGAVEGAVVPMEIFT